MAKSGIGAGTKLDITASSGDAEIELKSSFVKETGGKLQLSTPMSGGKSVPLPVGAPLHITWVADGNDYAMDATVSGTVKQGVRTYLMATALNEPQRIERRRAVRIPAEIDVEFTIFETLSDGTRGRAEWPGKTSDISNGGLAVYTNAPMAVGEVVDVSLNRKGTKKLPLKGTVCWIRPAPRTAGFKTSCGLQFLFANTEENAALLKLTAALAAAQG